MKSEHSKEVDKAYINEPWWHLVFFVIGFVILFLIAIPVRFVTGLSSASDRVFAIEALIAGLLTELILKKWFQKELYLIPKLEVRFYYVWILLSFYVFVFQPFE